MDFRRAVTRRLDPDEEIVSSERASQEKIDLAYRYLDNRAATAMTFGELDKLKERNEAVFRRTRDTKWAGVGEEKYRHCNEIIGKRYDKLREKESSIKVGAGLTKGPGPIVGGSGVVEKRTTREPPKE
jgi:hypothetical protein